MRITIMFGLVAIALIISGVAEIIQTMDIKCLKSDVKELKDKVSK